MERKQIKTYSRKRKRADSDASNPKARTSTPPLPAKTYIVEAAKTLGAQEAAATTLPSPPITSSPLASSSPLQPISANIISSPLLKRKQPPTAVNAKHTAKKKLTQLTLDLGGNPRRRCVSCGMEYVPSNAEDAKLHRVFHSASVGGVDVPAGVDAKWRVVTQCGRRVVNSVASNSTTKTKNSAREGLDVIVEVGKHDRLSVRNVARKVLGVVEAELSGFSSADGLWSTARSDDTECRLQDGHKVYLYVRGAKCVGLCYAERIASAFQVLPHTRGSPSSSSVSTSEQAVAATLGISRIWVSREFRHHGIARELLETARKEFLYGAELRKDDVAFSQPTESGGKLARAWFGKQDGWMVYDLSRSPDGQTKLRKAC